MKKTETGFKQKINDIIWFSIFVLFMFQNAVNLYIPILKYTDEVAMLACAGYAFFKMLKTKTIETEYIKMIVLMILMIILGIVCNIKSDIYRSFFMIVRDIIYFFKVFICFIGAGMYFQDRMEKSRLLDLVAEFVRCTVVIAFVCMIISQIMDIGMTRGIRYGFQCFQFVYSVPGMFSQYCIIYLNILTADLNNHKLDLKRAISILLLFIVWISTGRSRGFVTIAIWCFLMAVSYNWNRLEQLKSHEAIKRIFNVKYLIVMGALALVLGWGQIMKYFSGKEVTARGLLVNGGVQIMKDYFPLGSGFGTFGTETAAVYYSPLYYRYGLDTFYSLKRGGDNLTDCYWPAVGAELGILGIILMSILIFLLLKKFIFLANGKKFFFITALTYAIYLLFSSTATGAFCSYVTAEFIIISVAIISNDTTRKTVINNG